MEKIDLMTRLKEYRINKFYSHVYFILENYLEKWVRSEFISKISSISSFEFTAVILEDRPNKLLRFSIINTLLMTRAKMKIIIFTTNDKLVKMNQLFSDISEFVEIRLLNYDQSFIKKLSIQNYNKTMFSAEFWRQLPTNNILLFQTDSLLIEPLNFLIFEYDYVGAPFAKEKYISTIFPNFSDNDQSEIAGTWITQVFNRKHKIPDGIFQGNGGLSIRNRDVMIKICENEIPLNDENEDIYFSRLVQKYSSRLPSLATASRFSCECEYYKSIGFHASYLYLSSSQQAEIYERHLKYVMSLTL